MITTDEIIQSTMPTKWKQNKLEEKLTIHTQTTLNINLKNKLTDTYILGNQLKLTKNEIREVQDIILQIKDFKKLCATCSNEQIIVIMCLRTKRRYNKKVELDRYGVWKEYKITWKLYSLISDRIGYHFHKPLFK